ncbi:DUF5709 domain-containing protein [Nocardioides sp. R-C-SC26]|uniref:DUF5709 domain-containing protein n=1 Tax=Nocardioides sp. R-C-SC26 TaxID=2870414 RepID=UPI001E37DB7B|nr:DUF5709 domain-containing protein [Nocardioides sp. R-C-SC26]
MSETPEDLPDDVEDQPVAEDQLLDPDVEDELDRGYSPPESWSAGQGFGNTPYEESVGESFEQRLAQEVPDVDADAEVAPDEQADLDAEVGRERAGRLVAPDEGIGEDEEKDLIGIDVGIDGAAASAEEAAMHVVADDEF